MDTIFRLDQRANWQRFFTELTGVAVSFSASQDFDSFSRSKGLSHSILMAVLVFLRCGW